MGNIDFGYTYELRGNSLSIRIRFSNACDAADKVMRQIDTIQAEIDRLEIMGLIDAQVYWSRKDDPNGKPDQLELTHSTTSAYYHRNGTRREYIGVKPEKIHDALEGVKRYHEHIKLREELKSLMTRITIFENQLRHIEGVFAKQLDLI